MSSRLTESDYSAFKQWLETTSITRSAIEDIFTDIDQTYHGKFLDWFEATCEADSDPTEIKSLVISYFENPDRRPGQRLVRKDFFVRKLARVLASLLSFEDFKALQDRGAIPQGHEHYVCAFTGLILRFYWREVYGQQTPPAPDQVFVLVPKLLQIIHGKPASATYPWDGEFSLEALRKEVGEVWCSFADDSQLDLLVRLELYLRDTVPPRLDDLIAADGVMNWLTFL